MMIKYTGFLFFVFVILALLALTEKEQWSFLSGLWEKKKKNNISKSPVALKSAKEKLHTKHLSWNRKPGAFLCWSTASEHHKARGNTQTDTGDLFFFFFSNSTFFEKLSCQTELFLWLCCHVFVPVGLSVIQYPQGL